MIVALFCVAAAMIASGVWAVFTGWELIIIERGWTQVLLGGMLFTGGMLLGGVGVLAVHVRRLTRKLDQTASPTKPLLEGDAIPARRNEMPPPPQPEPRQTAYQEPLAEAAPEPFPETERPAASTISAPASIALGAAAGAGTAAIASAILSSPEESKPDSGHSAGEQDVGEHLFEDIDESQERAPSEEVVPTPDGENFAMNATAEAADTASTGAVDAESGGLAEGEEHVIPPVEETALLNLPDEVEREPLSEQEELYSPPAEHLDEEAMSEEDGPTLPSEASPVREGLFMEEEQASAGLPSKTTSQAPHVEEEHEEPRVEEESLIEPVSLLTEAPAEVEPAIAPEVQEPEVQEQGEEVAEQEPAPRSLVGTYDSGGNVYTMFSDGSIDARTPSGDFHFASLEELKNFIAEGGEDPVA